MTKVKILSELPVPAGKKSTRPEVSASTLSKGIGRDRLLTRTIKDAKSADEGGSYLALQQLAEVADGGRSGLQFVNMTVRQEAGLEMHVMSPQKMTELQPKHCEGEKRKPVVDQNLISDSEVKDCTGFDSLTMLLQYIVVVSNGSVDAMLSTNTSMSWFEEWYFFFEVIWGKTITRWTDAERIYKVSKKRLLNVVFTTKLAAVKEAVSRWPRFLSHKEDMELRSGKWTSRYNNKRVIMWDNTNVNFYGKPTDAMLQRLTFSQYYNGNVAKGGVFLQLCGWLGGWELWSGAVSDTDYFDSSGILEFQKMFQEADESSKVPFTNIVDKGYRSVLAAWRKGGQLLLQPFFAKSDRKFTSKEVLLSGAVASDRSANERAVKRLKLADMICKGIHPRQDLIKFSDVWIVWGFQCNFMFKPVL
ncbi:MAG TPA: hypothetical protein VLS94_00795 [Fusibacter sp.]|nr:hypothetical protein [Fusibacter sp.]